MLGAFLNTKRSWPITITIILAAEIFVADLILPLGLAVWLPYAGLVLISLWTPQKSHTLYIAVAATVLLLLAGFLAPPGATEIPSFQSLFNRTLGVLFIWMTAGFCFQRKRVEETERETHDNLERLVRERTVELSQSNEQLQHEVAQRKLALAELEQTRRQQLELKDQFLSHVSHELRSPLTAIYQFATILSDGLAGDLSREQREYLEIVLRNANQLRAMIEDLLEVTRVQTGKLSIKAQSTSIAELVDETVASLRALAGGKGITLSADAPAHLPTVYADPQRIRQVLRNLIENGIKFTPENGSVTIRAQLSDEEHRAIRIAVTDTGCGIDPEDRERIFERLYQGKSMVEASRKGLGLGLSICKELVSRHGGRIWVESQLGHGSTFVFTLSVVPLETLLAQLITARPSLYTPLTVISVGVYSIGKRPLTPTDEGVLKNLRDTLMRCRRAEQDVLLPEIGRLPWGEIFYIVVQCDQRSADMLTHRIRQELARCDDLQRTGLVTALSSTAIDTASLGTGQSVGRVAQHAVRDIEERLHAIAGEKEV